MKATFRLWTQNENKKPAPCSRADGELWRLSPWPAQGHASGRLRALRSGDGFLRVCRSQPQAAGLRDGRQLQRCPRRQRRRLGRRRPEFLVRQSLPLDRRLRHAEPVGRAAGQRRGPRRLRVPRLRVRNQHRRQHDRRPRRTGRRRDVRGLGRHHPRDDWSEPCTEHQLFLIHSQLVFTWPTNYAGFTPQCSTGLGSTNWTTCTNPIIASGGFNFVTNPLSAGAQFFRLKK